MYGVYVFMFENSSLIPLINIHITTRLFILVMLSNNKFKFLFQWTVTGEGGVSGRNVLSHAGVVCSNDTVSARGPSLGEQTVWEMGLR